MDIPIKITNTGIYISARDDADNPPQRSTTADQENPRRCYVYAHEDKSGNIFYVGKGTGKRAWARDRHPLWFRYVVNHLGNEYNIIILEDNLSSTEAEEIEGDWITYLGSTLVNWVNYGREIDLKALERYHTLRNENKALISKARIAESKNLIEAAEMYLKALAAIPSYESIEYEGGLVGKLMKEEAAEIGCFGEIEALDRLTMCLIKLDRVDEAVEQFDSYFKLYAGDLDKAAVPRIKKRIDKALAKKIHKS